MFTLEQIRDAHSRVRSGADFPKYVRDIESLGVTSYEAFVSDGRVRYRGTDGFETMSPGNHSMLEVSDIPDAERFRLDLIAHQQGKTDYPNFLRDCAESGIEKWIVSVREMTCTYYDQAGELVLTEKIPG